MKQHRIKLEDHRPSILEQSKSQEEVGVSISSTQGFATTVGVSPKFVRKMDNMVNT